MRVIYIFALMIVLTVFAVGFVSAQPTTDGDFGEKETIWTRIGDFISGIFAPQEFAFTSETPESDYVTSNYGTFQKVAYETELACYNCNEGDYCQVSEVDPDTGVVTDLFSDYWYMSYDRDYLDLASSDYYTRPLTFIYGYTCWTPPEPDVYIYSCRENSAEDSASIYYDGNFERKVATAECKLSDKEYSSVQSIDTVEDDMINRLDVCYSCDGSEAITDVRDGCSGEWESTRLTDSECLDRNTVQCYTCDENMGVAESDTYEGSCPTGWQEQSLTDEDCTPETTTRPCYRCVEGQLDIQEYEQCPSGFSEDPVVCDPVTCYRCENGTIETTTATGGCPSGYVSTEPETCEDGTVSCYQCSNGVVISELKEECSGNWTSEELTAQDCRDKKDCEEGQVFCILGQWYEDNSPQSYVVSFASVIIILAWVFMLRQPSGKKPQATGRLGL